MNISIVIGNNFKLILCNIKALEQNDRAGEWVEFRKGWDAKKMRSKD